jgi:hypothetical protein
MIIQNISSLQLLTNSKILNDPLPFSKLIYYLFGNYLKFDLFLTSFILATSDFNYFIIYLSL